MNAEIFAALAQLEKERGIPQDYMLEKITQALIAAYKKDKEGYTDNVFVEIKDNDMHMYVQKEVVDDVLTPATEISLDEARKINKHADLGDLVNVDVKTQAFGRIAAQTAKQGIREAERGMIFDTFSSKEHEILSGSVLRADPTSGDLIIRLTGGSDKTSALLSRSEQVPTEHYTEGDMIRVYVVEVRRRSSSPGRTRASSSACSSWRFRRLHPARSRSNPSPARPAPVPRSPSMPQRPMSTRSAPASARAADVSARSSTSCTAKRWTSSSGRRTRASSWPRPSARPRSFPSRSCPARARPAVLSSRTISSPSPSARRARTQDWPPA